MRSIVSVLALFLVSNLCLAGEVTVNWKSNGLDLVSENKLPSGARIKIRVAYLDETRTMRVNGQEFKIEKRDDNCRASVGNDGRITISVLGLKPIGRQIDGSDCSRRGSVREVPTLRSPTLRPEVLDENEVAPIEKKTEKCLQPER